MKQISFTQNMHFYFRNNINKLFNYEYDPCNDK